MSKCYVVELVNVYLHIMKDVLYAYPSLKPELSKDWQRLTRLVTQRGLHFFTVDLPAMGKHLDRCVTMGLYKVSGLPGASRVSGTVPIPKLFRGLYLQIFTKDGRLKETIDDEAYFFLRQLLFGAKKVSLDCSEEATRREVESFISTDGSLPDPGPFWLKDLVEEHDIPTRGFAADGGHREGRTTTLQGVSTEDPQAASKPEKASKENLNLWAMLDTVSSLVALTLGHFDPDKSEFRHGPGAASDLRVGENRYRFDSWPDRLDHVFPWADCCFSNYWSWADHLILDQNRGGVSRPGDQFKHDCDVGDPLVPMSKLCAVKKTMEKPRLIAAEPHYHMWCQQNVRHFMYSQTEESWIGQFIKFDDQTQNQELCVRGSIDGLIVTLDLSDASNRISCRHVEKFFRANVGLLLALRASRTRYVEERYTSQEGSVVDLRMYATMGNATTFPVQSLIFLGCALTACLVDRGVKPREIWDSPDKIQSLVGQVSVFGDDIVLPKEHAGTLIKLLELLEFKVNINKSFMEGNFRESCGVDCFRGENISPVYYHGPYEGTPASYASTIEVSNNFYRRFLVNTSEYLRSTIERFRIPLVPYGSGYLGWESFVSPSESQYTFKCRWNRDLQRKEYWIPCIIAQNPRAPIEDDSALLQFFTEHPDPSIQWEGGVAGRSVQKIKHRWVPVSDLSRSPCTQSEATPPDYA